MPPKSETGPFNIVVLGGGGAGVQVVRELCAAKPPAKYRVILITDRDRYAHMPALLRLVVKIKDRDSKGGDKNQLNEQQFEQRFNDTFLPYTAFRNKRSNQLTLKFGTVERVEAKADGTGGTVVLQKQRKGNTGDRGDGERIPFQYLVCATGRTWEGPLIALHRGEQLKNTVLGWRVKFEKATQITLVGAGAVGLELAGELLDEYPTGKTITIVHRSDLPLNDSYPRSFREDIRNGWEKRGVVFRFNQSLDNYEISPEGKVRPTATNGASVVPPLETDLIVFLRGGRPNTNYLSSLNVLSAEGYVKVEPTLQVVNYPRIFAAGDILDTPEQKTLSKTPRQGSIVSTNIMNLINNKKTKNYKGMFEGLFITNGENKGAGFVGVLWGLTFGDKVVPMVKGKTLFVEMAKQALDLA